MKEMCQNFICDTGVTGPDEPQTPPTADSCTACVLAKVGLAQAFVQPMEQEQSLVCGTAFSELAMPYCQGWHLYQSAKEA